ncbi:DUF1365 domain-containing protein [Xanthobacteraceae bacterium A53D]
MSDAPDGGASALYAGTVMHHRLRPRVHRLSYRIFSVLLDIDAIDETCGRLRLFSRNRFNLFSFRDRDYGDGSATPLRAQVEALLERAGLANDGGAIRLFTMPRILGYAFNPLSVYFCHRRDGTLQAILYEVSNTFGERHSYFIPVAGDGRGPIRQSTEKCFYVSPFMDMGLTYRFRVLPPDERIAIGITASDSAGTVLTASLASERMALSDRNLLRLFATMPLLTLKVVAGIHWEALQIFLKGVGFRHRPAPPRHGVSIARQDG